MRWSVCTIIVQRAHSRRIPHNGDESSPSLCSTVIRESHWCQPGQICFQAIRGATLFSKTPTRPHTVALFSLPPISTGLVEKRLNNFNFRTFECEWEALPERALVQLSVCLLLLFPSTAIESFVGFVSKLYCRQAIKCVVVGDGAVGKVCCKMSGIFAHC